MPTVKLYIWSRTFKMFNTSLLLSVGIECTRARSHTHNHTVLPDHTHFETLCVFSSNTAIKSLECNCPVRLMPLKIAPGHTVRHVYKKETIKFDNSITPVIFVTPISSVNTTVWAITVAYMIQVHLYILQALGATKSTVFEFQHQHGLQLKASEATL